VAEAIRADKGWKILAISLLSYLEQCDRAAHPLYPAASLPQDPKRQKGRNDLC